MSNVPRVWCLGPVGRGRGAASRGCWWPSIPGLRDGGIPLPPAGSKCSILSTNPEDFFIQAKLNGNFCICSQTTKNALEKTRWKGSSAMIYCLMSTFHNMSIRSRQFKKVVQPRTGFNRFWSTCNWSTEDFSCGLNMELHSGLKPRKCIQSVLLQISSDKNILLNLCYWV